MLLHSDSFDHYTTIAQKYEYVNSGGISSTAARNGIAGFRALGNSFYISKQLGTHATSLIAGFAMKADAYPTANGWILYSHADFSTGISSPTGQVALFISATGFLSIIRHNSAFQVTATLGTSSIPVPNLSGWHYYELKATFASGTGSAEARIDGVVYVSVSGVTTIQTANAYADGAVLNTGTFVGGQGGAAYFDDYYVCDATGSTNNNYLGDITVTAIVPNGNGTVNNFSIGGTSPAATNWQSVREIPPDDGVTLVQSSSVGDIDRYTYPSVVPTPGTPYAVVAWPRAAKDVSGGRSIRVSVKSGATTTDSGTDLPLSQSYQYLKAVFETDPNTSAQWTLSNIAAAEFGVKITA